MRIATRSSSAITCGPRERAVVFEALARAVDGEELDEHERALVSGLDDGVLVFLVRALLRGRLAPDGRLFLSGDELASADPAWGILEQSEDLDEAAPEGAPDPYVSAGGSPATSTSNEPHR